MRRSSQMFQLLFIACVLFFVACLGNSEGIEEEQVAPVEKPDEKPVDNEPTVILPLSDLSNTGNWELNLELSDEFDAAELDEAKWLIQGKNGVFKSNFVGRAPSQFSTENVRLEDGKLKLETRWEPDYNFRGRINNGNMYDEVGGEKIYFENITTAAVIAKYPVHYGYLEVKTKAADAEVTSSFWATGNGVEFDFFEMFGDHKQVNKERAGKERELWWSIHDWTSNGGGKTTYTEHHDLGFRVADAFHTYGYEWSSEGIKIYIDGTLFRNVTREEINAYDDVQNGGGNGTHENFVTTKPLYIWFDQETFPWHGVPDSKAEVGGDGCIDFEIEYYRVWQ